MMDAWAGNGGKVGVGVSVGNDWTTAVLVTAMVGVAGNGVTGSAVGTGPTGSMTFLT